MIFYSQYDILLLPTLLLSLLAQWFVSSSYKKYSKYGNMRNISGADAVRRILGRRGLDNIRTEHVSGQLTDHYDPRANVIRLSDGVYNSSSVAAVGIAAHEAGHALQHAEGYFPIKARNAVLPVANIASRAAVPLFILGIIMAREPLVTAGILLFSGVLLFQVITLPVEINASRRAISVINELDILSDDELKGAKRVLFAAAMTYVAAMLTSLMQLLRLMAIANNGRRRR